jgi:hypothetical protein
MSLRSLTLRHGLAVAACVVLLGGCPSSELTTSTEDAGADEGGSTFEAGPAPLDGSAPDSGGVVCGRLTTKCTNGEKCSGADDCASAFCFDGLCKETAPADGVKNGDETDVDCGGSKAPACANLKGCAVKADCASGVCTNKICQVPTSTDTVQNGDETGVDCGGSTTSAPKCPAGSGCLTNADCDNIKCDTAQKKCLPASHTDGIKNLGETGPDCGGAALPATCTVGQGCAVLADCANTKCNAGTLVCDPPSKTDKIKNGTETDEDCGGGAPTNADRCADDLSCLVGGDCASTFCSKAGKCVAGESCKAPDDATSGIVTCGKRETNDGTKVHESCCRTLPLPVSTTVRLDKYEVTAGRMRQFIERVGPNLRSWAQTAMADAASPLGARLKNDLISSSGANMSDLLPASANPSDPMNMLQQVGATVMDSRVPSNDQGCFNGPVGSGAYGANTYYWDGVTLRAHFTGHVDRTYTKAQYDEKSMNCGAYWMYAAFCAWDGGRMPTEAEMNEAYGAMNYPWNTAGGSNTFGFPLDANHQGAYGYEATANYFNTNNFFFYHYPTYPDETEKAGLIAAPGRFILDSTTKTSANGEHWMDLGANLMEMTRFRTPQSGNNTFCDFSITNGPGDVPNIGTCKDGANAGVVRKTGLPDSVWVGGSWEGHQQFTTNPGSEPWFNKASYNLPAQTQYGKTGVRCAR